MQPAMKPYVVDEVLSWRQGSPRDADLLDYSRKTRLHHLPSDLDLSYGQ